ncbi:endonuclease/exonuclease/phosphatase family protein [Chryseobacterium gossypii]|uniref:endonuclease/exonuclease/phosphatase family protein n=1 Tax=Chryseobacterium gossypii TaxID=3231602 RepID=UPI003524C812
MMKQNLNFIYLLIVLFVTSCQTENLEMSEINEETNVSALRKGNNEITVMAYNLHLFVPFTTLEDAVRQEKIIQFIRSNSSANDVLYLSEIWRDDTKNEFVESLKDIYPYSMHSNTTVINPGDGLLILSKFPIQESSFNAYNDSAGDLGLVSKGFHKTRFSTPNGDFYSFFTHAQDSGHISIRKKQFEQIKSNMNDLEGIPSIITGDLNVIGDRLLEYTDMKSLFANYKDSFRESNSISGFTYDNTLNKLADYFYPVASNGPTQERLDYVLVSEGLNTVSSQVISDCNYQSSYFNSIIPCSDHYGIQSTLSFTKSIHKPEAYVVNTYNEAVDKINGLKAAYGTGQSAKIIIHNNSNRDLVFYNKTQWYNSTFFSSPPSKISSGKYGVILATHDTGEATGVFNQLTYVLGSVKLSFGTYVPWSYAFTNNVLVGFNEITKNDLETNSTRPSLSKVKDNIKLTGKISTGDSPFVEFSVENN